MGAGRPFSGLERPHQPTLCVEDCERHGPSLSEIKAKDGTGIEWIRIGCVEPITPRAGCWCIRRSEAVPKVSICVRGVAFQVYRELMGSRGPVGVEGLLTYRWLLRGNGQVASAYGPGKKKFTHRDL